jgi:hypothetical protein
VIKLFIYVGEVMLATYFILDVVVPFVRRKPLFPMARSINRKEKK